MGGRSISVFADDSEEGIVRVRTALAIARSWGALLTVVVLAPMPEPIQWAEASLLSAELQELRRGVLQRAQTAAKSLKAIDPHGIEVVVRDFLSGDLRAWAASAARVADLVVVAQPDKVGGSEMEEDIFAGALLGGGRPCLMLPRTCRSHVWGRRAYVAWKGTPEAARAVQSALPFLKDAETVRLCLFNPRGAREGEDVQGMAALANYLQRHGVPVETPLILDAADGPERAILSELDAFSADLLIMGAYSRTRFQEIVFGGMTATIVREARVPVLLTH